MSAELDPAQVSDAPHGPGIYIDIYRNATQIAAAVRPKKIQSINATEEYRISLEGERKMTAARRSLIR